MSEVRFPFGVFLSSVLVSIIIIFWWLEFAFSDSKSEVHETILYCIIVVYLIFLLRYFVTNEGRRYTVSAFSISVTLSTFAWGYYDSQVGGWFWNDDWVLEDALLASIRPPIILLFINEVGSLIFGLINGNANSGKSHRTSLITIGLVASLPLCVAAPLGLIILIPVLVIFFILYWASTTTPLRLSDN